MKELKFSPTQATEYATRHDVLFYALTALVVLFTVLVGVAVLYLMIKYRASNKNVDRTKRIHHHLGIEIAWTVIPTILALIIFFWGLLLFKEVKTPDKDSSDIYVIGKQWMWQFQHPNGIRENNELHVPVGRPVKITMISQDVIHSLYIPQFRVQFYTLPGRYTSMHFTPNVVGKFNIFCSMHCGADHSKMGGYIHVLSPSDYTKWLENGGNRFSKNSESMIKSGLKTFAKNGCSNCHGGADTYRAPSLHGLIGRKRKMNDGRVVIADEAYIRESILTPYNNVVEGYEQIMPVYDLSEGEVLELVEYIKSLSRAPSMFEENEKVYKNTRNHVKNISNSGEINLEMRVDSGVSQSSVQQVQHVSEQN